MNRYMCTAKFSIVIKAIYIDRVLWYKLDRYMSQKYRNGGTGGRQNKRIREREEREVIRREASGERIV